MKLLLCLLLSLVGLISASDLTGYDGWKYGSSLYPGLQYGSGGLGWKGGYGGWSYGSGLGWKGDYGGWNYGSGLGLKGWTDYKHTPLTGYGGYGLGLGGGYGLGYGLGYGHGYGFGHSSTLDPWC